MDTRIALVSGVVVAALSFGLGRVTAAPAPAEPTEPSSTEPTVGEAMLVDPRPALRVIAQVRKDAHFFVRVAARAYGDGFSTACRGFDATEDECDRAYQEALGLCSPATGTCFRPIPGYFHWTASITNAMRGQLERRIYSRLEERLCAQIPEPDERLAAWCP